MRRTITFAVTACVLAWAHSARAGGPSRLLKGPYVTAASDSGADVRFELDAPGAASVELPGKPPVVDAAAVAFHSVHVTGLDTSKRQDFYVRASGVVVGKGSISPWPKAGSPVSLLAYGNARGNAPAMGAHGSVVHLLGALPADLLLNMGDVVDDASRDADWQSFFDVEAPLLRDRLLVFTPGERDLAGDRTVERVGRYFGAFRTLRMSNVRLFAFDDGDGTDRRRDGARDALTRALVNADNEPGVLWRIAISHRRLWSSSPGSADADTAPNRDVLRLLAAHRVDLLLAGHDALYERGDTGGIKYVVSGGGGAPLDGLDPSDPAAQKAESVWHAVAVKTDGDSIAVEARRVDGVVLDKCSFRKGTAWDCTSPNAAAPALTPRVPPSLASALAARAEGTAPVALTADPVGAPGIASDDGGRAADPARSSSRWALPWACAIAAVGLGGAIVAMRRRRRL
jgi:hypothetical protein